MYLQKPIVLCKNIAALAIEADQSGHHRYGLIEQLPTGASVMLIGEGFNGRTIKVECNGRYYFAFVQDIGGCDSSYYLD